MAEDRRNPVLAEVEARAEVLAPHRYDLSSVAVARTLSPGASAAPPILKITWTRSPLAGLTARSTGSGGNPHHNNYY